jgi:hypothetical protein
VVPANDAAVALANGLAERTADFATAVAVRTAEETIFMDHLSPGKTRAEPYWRL